jgi:hypothetical protein
MSTALVAPPKEQTQVDPEALEKVLLEGDLSNLKPAERIAYYKAVCESVGLNPLTKPFEYLKLNGKLTLYALRSCTDQLRQIHGVSVIIPDRQIMDDVYVVTARATLPTGRTDESQGAVPIGSLKGEAKANAFMKGETKAKRRVTLSICGLSMLDETEIESIPGAQPAPHMGEPAKIVTIEEGKRPEPKEDPKPQPKPEAKADPKPQPKQEAAPTPAAQFKARMEGLAKRYKLEPDVFKGKHFGPFMHGFFSLAPGQKLPTDLGLYAAPMAALEGLTEQQQGEFLADSEAFGRALVAKAAQAVIEGTAVQQPAETPKQPETPTPVGVEFSASTLIPKAAAFRKCTPPDVIKFMGEAGITPDSPATEISAFLRLACVVKTAKLASTTAKQQSTTVADVVGKVEGKLGKPIEQAEAQEVEAALLLVASGE